MDEEQDFEFPEDDEVQTVLAAHADAIHHPVAETWPFVVAGLVYRIVLGGYAGNVLDA